MLKSEINALTLSVAIAAITVARLSQETEWTGLAAGVLVTLTLLAFGGGERGFWRSLAFSAVAGYALATAVAAGLKLFGFGRATMLTEGGLWLGLTAVFLIIDRVRANAPAAPRNTSRSHTTVDAPPMETTGFSEADATSAPPSSRPAPPANAVELPLNAGKPATIYLNITNTGIVCLRPVQAEHLGRDFYRIVETVPPDEQWEFTTGQIVRCKKRSLSSGKSMVAVEEAPRADR